MKKDRITEKFETLKAAELDNQKFEPRPDKPVDPLVAAEERYRETMTNPETVPEWARPATHGQHMPADVKVTLDRLSQEEDEAQRKVDETKAAKQAVLDAQAEQAKLDQERAQIAKTVPDRLRAASRAVQAFVPTPVVAAPEDPVQRGIDALARARRRLNGEVIEEPEYTAPAPAASVPATSAQDALRGRVAPALTLATDLRSEIEAWETAVGKSLDAYFVPAGEDTKEQIENLMRGVPPTHPNLALVTSLLNIVRAIVTSKNVQAATLEREARSIESLVARTDYRGPMEVMGDRSREWYMQERDLVGALQALGTVTADSVAALWIGANAVIEKLEALAAIRASHAGEAVEPLQWHNVGEVLTRAEVAKRTGEQVFSDEPGGRQIMGRPWSPLDSEVR